MLRIGWFSTGAGAGSQRQRLLTATVDAIQRRDLAAEIAFVFCNRERGENEGFHDDSLARVDFPAAPAAISPPCRSTI